MKDLIAIKVKIKVLKWVRQKNSSFGLTNLRLHVLGEEKGEKRRRRGTRRRRRISGMVLFGIMCILDF